MIKFHYVRLIFSLIHDIISIIMEVIPMFDTQKFLKEMGRRMYAQRKQLGLTQEQVAELADISPQLLSNAENGTQVIGSDKLYRISLALGVSADYLLSGELSGKDIQILENKMGLDK